MIDPNKICFRCMTPLTGESAICPVCGADIDALENQSNQLPVGSILAGKYLVGCVLGQGGFGITYIGWDMNLDVKIAIKEYYPEGFVGRDTVTQCSVLPYTGDKSAYFFAGREKFVNEAKVLARFSTEPGVVSVRDYFHENGTAYIVMDYLEGATLKALAKSRGGKLLASEVLPMLYPVMDTLSRIHKAGLLHRDIAPDNIILQPNGQAVLLDFGAARQISAMGEHSNTINVKHGFAPEEQYRTRGEQGPWSDVYALCATIYWLTTGKTPPQANDRLAGDDELIPPRQLGAVMTQAQELALMRGLAVKGRDRQQSMAELKTGLTEAAPATPKAIPALVRPVNSAAGSEARETAGSEQAAEHDARPEPIELLIQKKTDEENRSKTKELLVWLVLTLFAVCCIYAPFLSCRTAVPPVSPVAEVAAETPSPTATSVPTPTPRTYSASEVTRDFDYDVGIDGIVLTRYIGDEEQVEIPDNVEGTPVTGIGNAAFYKNETLSTVSIPDGLTSIGERAFFGCKNLTAINIPDSVTSIGDYAFARCDALTSITIPDSVTSIGNSAFDSCDALTSITIPDSVTSIGNSAFDSCFALTSITIPDGVTSIGNHAFSGCGALHSITIPDGVTSIGDYAFDSCFALTSITIPDGVTSIGDWAFGWCTVLTSIVIPDSVTSIGSGAFYGCEALKSITIPNNVRIIGNEAFRGTPWLDKKIYATGDYLILGDNAIHIYVGSDSHVSVPSGAVSVDFSDADSVVSVQLPDSVTNIGDFAFSECNALESITIPDSVTSIGDDAFYMCSALTSITIPDSVTSIGDYAFARCDALTFITIPDSVTSIRNCAFAWCDALTSITIPDSVTSIGNSAFDSCFALTSITIPDGVTSIGHHAFSGCGALHSITIPDGVTSIGDYAFDGCFALTIRCHADSYAEQYAKDNGIPYKLY